MPTDAARARLVLYLGGQGSIPVDENLKEYGFDELLNWNGKKGSYVLIDRVTGNDITRIVLGNSPALD